MRAPLRATVAVLSCVATVAAQDVAAIDASDVRHYAELLSLDEEQQAAAIERYRVYRAEMREATNALRDMAMDQAIDSAKDLRENGIAGAYFRSFLRATADVDGSLDVYTKPQRIEHELIEDLVAFAVTPEQRAGVERVERAWRRDRASAIENPMGDTADVIEMARRLGHHELEPIADVLLEYEIAIDPIRTAQIVDFSIDPAAQREAASAEDLQLLGLRAKRLNIEFARRIKEALPADDHDRWDQAVREAFWPEPYRRSGPQKVIGALRLNRTLTDADRERLKEIAARYAERAGPINRDWAAALDAKLTANANEDWVKANDARETIYKSRELRRNLDHTFERELAEFGRELQSR